MRRFKALSTIISLSLKHTLWAIQKEASISERPVAVYLTDGDGDFPDKPPTIDTLWVVCKGDIPSSGFSFGEVNRIDD